MRRLHILTASAWRESLEQPNGLPQSLGSGHGSDLDVWLALCRRQQPHSSPNLFFLIASGDTETLSESAASIKRHDICAVADQTIPSTPFMRRAI
jgi:hypothetical protein